MSRVDAKTARHSIGFGPRVPQNGSWVWIGEDLAAEAGSEFNTFHWDEPPEDCDVIVIVKYPLDEDRIERLGKRSRVVYFPVDYFQSAAQIRTCEPFLRRCHCIVASSPTLRPLFERYATAVCLEHHVKYSPRRMVWPKSDGFILWTGVRTNLPWLVEWLNSHELPRRLLILTNPDEEQDALSAEDFGIRGATQVSIERWSADRHLEALGQARACLDIKGPDFSQLHKPPTKAVDFLASGLPFATNADSSPAAYLKAIGLDVVAPHDVNRWFSPEYLTECTRTGALLREYLNVHRVGERFRRIIHEVLSTRERKSSRDMVNAAISPPRPLGGEDVSESGTSGYRPCRTKVAIASFLFNWPSTGGGIIHTMELAKFLTKDGFDVLHIYARNQDWNVGCVDGELPYAARPLEFSGLSISMITVLDAFRDTIEEFGPDHVIITDSWNIKPWLAMAVGSRPYMLRFQALECLCPLNNVRFLPGPNGQFAQCGKHQLASPDACRTCVSERGHLSGGLHQWERGFCGVGSREYDRVLHEAIRKAEAVLVVNPDMATMLSPYSDHVHVVPSGFDADRFPWPVAGEQLAAPRPLRILFAGLVEEWIKGFPYLREACGLLWQRRQDFELWVTAEPYGDPEPFVRFVGWQSQAGLAEQLRRVDIVAVPTIAQEALGRTAVEAMAAGKPVVASRIGGLRSTILEGCTGLLAEPGDVQDLASQIEALLDDPDLARRLGQAGRKRFEKHFAWDVIISQFYRPLLTVGRTSIGPQHRALVQQRE